MVIHVLCQMYNSRIMLRLKGLSGVSPSLDRHPLPRQSLSKVQISPTRSMTRMSAFVTIYLGGLLLYRGTSDDVILLAFLGNFGGNTDLTPVNIAFHSLAETQSGIATCQAAGKPVILSIGGSAGTYGFVSSGDAEATAQQIWDAYLGGSGGSRPFGSAVLDGVDLDIENNHGSQYYADFVDKLQSLWSGASKRYYLTAVPQCPYPDANLDPVLQSRTGSFDYVLIQFYNNNCGYSGNDNAVIASYKQWTGLLPASKLVPTFPASTSAAGSGYADPAATAQTLRDTTTANFGLFSVGYDQDNAATPGSSPFWSEQVRSLLGSAAPTTSEPTQGTTTSSPAAPAPESPSPSTPTTPTAPLATPSTSGCPTGAAGDTFCQGKTGQYYANPCDCSQFVQCSNDMAYVQSCGTGTSWSQSALTCTAGSCTS